MKLKRTLATIMLAACTYAAVAQNAGTPANNKTFFVAKPGTLVSMLTEVHTQVKAALTPTVSIFIRPTVYRLMHSASRPATVLSPEKQLSRKLFFQRKSRT